MKKNSLTAGLIYGPEFHHLDHLAPLCAQMGIPLILTEREMVEQAQAFYPDLEVIHWSTLEVPDQLVSHFDTIYYSTPRVLFDEIFFFAQAFQNKRIKTIWVPHGNSDKGRSSVFMEALRGEEELLTYGPRIETFLREKGVSGKFTRIGNYRLAYFQKHKEFYQNLMPRKEKPTILYAPTWQDQEKNSSFPTFWPYLNQAPKHFSLIVKLHPNLYRQFPSEIEELKRHVEILENFPPIYPILDITDLYIGDMSSIGYDFLAFKRPMILLKQSEYDQVFSRCDELMGKTPVETGLYEQTYLQ